MIINNKKMTTKPLYVKSIIIVIWIAGFFLSCNSSIKQENMPITDSNEDYIGEVTYENDSIQQNIDIEDTIVFLIVETSFEYPGGEEARMKFLQENLVYPKIARETGYEGKVIIDFVVEKDGSLTNFKIVKRVHPLLDQEALRVVKLMPKWIPEKRKGKAVSVKYRMPISFRFE